MKLLIFVFSLFTSYALADVPEPETHLRMEEGKTLVIAVIDTGFGLTDGRVKLCKQGHKDFSNSKAFRAYPDVKDLVPLDLHGHGTNIAGVIDQYAKESGREYCLVILKYYSPSHDNLKASTRAVNYATAIGAHIINYSGGGTQHSEAEDLAVKKFLDNGGIFVAAAGNENTKLTKEKPTYFPAQSDSRVISVGNLSENFKRAPTSNYGYVSRWEYGTNRKALGLVMTGTSQAAAVATGKIVGEAKIFYDKEKKIVALRK